MKYKGYEIRAEVRVLQQYRVDDDGNLVAKLDSDDENLEGYYWYSPASGESSQNFMTLAEAKADIELQAKPSADRRWAERQCVICAVEIREGYYCCDEYYCSQKCLNKDLEAGTTWEQHYEADGDCYWTEWDEDLNGVAYAA